VGNGPFASPAFQIHPKSAQSISFSLRSQLNGLGLLFEMLQKLSFIDPVFDKIALSACSIIT
jgi:hypothetical protein